MTELEAREGALVERLRGLHGALIGFSAGVDSTYLLHLAHEALGPRAVAVTADSPSLPRTTLAEAEAFCRAQGIAHRVVPTAEVEDPAYRRNDALRCARCKTALLEAMVDVAGAIDPAAALLLGVIADDLGDHRPGQEAARVRGAAFPLADAGFTKADVRARSRARGLVTWDRPAEPCLSSRIPYGEPATKAALRAIEAAESALHRRGLRECRARHHRVGDGRGALCRIEVPLRDLPAVLAQREALVREIRAAGYTQVCLDLAGLESGSLNALLRPDELVRRSR